MSSESSSRTVRVDGSRIERVLEPDSVPELCEFLKDIDRDDLHALIVGGGTRLSYGNSGGAYDVAISTRRLNRVLHYEPDDLTLATEPGCSIAEITDLLHKSGQMIALDAAHSERSTIGGAYATGMSGPRRLSGGSLKDWTIGIEVAGPVGVIAKAGGMVVKNVTGYDMMHVHHGALGAFGIVTRLNLKAFPLPGAPRAVVLTYDTPEEAHAAGVALLQSQLQPSSVVIANDVGWTLRVRCDAPPTAIERQARRVIETASAAAVPGLIDDSPRATRAVEPFLDVTDLLGDRGVARLSIPASKQPVAIENLAVRADQRICGDLGSGLLYVATSSPDVAWIEHIRSVSARPVFLALPAELKRGLDVFGGVEATNVEIVRRLKATYDPQGRFNRGRFALSI